MSDIDPKDEATVEILNEIVVPDRFYHRLKTGVQVLDEIFGGPVSPGLLKGESMLVTGMPGAGKSTLSLQLADLLQKNEGRNILYNVGEESKYMVKLAADRIGLAGAFCLGRFEQVDDLVEYCRRTGVEVLFVDSLQSMHDGELRGLALLRSVVTKLNVLAKEDDVLIFIIGHITKGGGFAGPQDIKHDVDAHAHLKLNPDSGNRVFEMQKNRFGPAMMPYEMMLSAQGLDFQTAHIEEPAEGGGRSSASDRRERVKALIKERLLAGEAISGYCFERLEVDCSGGFWRGMVALACRELRAEGHVIGEKRIDGRTHAYVEV